MNCLESIQKVHEKLSNYHRKYRFIYKSTKFCTTKVHYTKVHIQAQKGVEPMKSSDF